MWQGLAWIFLYNHCGQVWCTLEEFLFDSIDLKKDGRVAQTLVHKFDIILFGGVMV
jgi:hypothetical protein